MPVAHLTLVSSERKRHLSERGSHSVIILPSPYVQQTTWDRPEVRPLAGSPPPADEGDVAHLLKGMGQRAATEGYGVDPSEGSETEARNAFKVPFPHHSGACLCSCA